MLRLDKLEIRGFKSFCDYTEIIFHEGITAIIGPNGCGKSNVMDAVMWVLGEQSAKNLRGGKMEDVIFNGTRDRKPLGMAEVTVTLTAVIDIEPGKKSDEDLDAGALDVPELDVEAIEEEAARLGESPTEGEIEETDDEATEATPSRPVRKMPRRFRIPTLMAGEKITIGRRLYRSGESDYLINGRTCRLRDIQDFFSGTGLSRARYAIIEQGRIGQVLSSKPHDRRALIEEAAGVAKFKAKRHAAEMKLEGTKQNLSRLNDLISEIERQINALKRQAAKARKYAGLRDEMRLHSAVFFLRSAEFLKSELEAVEVALADSTRRLAALTERIQRRQAANAAARQAARDAESRLAETREQASQVELGFDRATNLRKHLDEQITQTSTRRREIVAEINRVVERGRVIDAELDRSRKDNDRLAGELTDVQARLVDVEARHRAESEALREAERELEQARTQLLAHVTRIERLRNQQNQLHDTQARLDRQKQNLETESKRAVERKAQADLELKESVAAHDTAQTKVRELREGLSQIDREAGQAAETLKQAQQALETVRRERARVEDRTASLRNLDEHHAYYSQTVRTLFDEAKKIPGLHVVGTLADFLNVPGEHESLVETILGDRIQSILVPTPDMAATAADWLDKKKSGRATFLVTGVFGGEDGGASAPAPEPSGKGEAAALLPMLGLSRELSACFMRAFPQLAGAKVVADLDGALAASAAEPDRLFVTTAGEQVLGCTLVVTRGSERPPASVLALKREIKELAKQLVTLEKRFSDAQETLETAQADLSDRREARQALDTELRRIESSVAALNVEVTQRRREVERAVQHQNVVAAEQSQLETERTNLVARLSQTNVELEQAEERHAKLEEDLAVVRETVAASRPSVEKITHELSEVRALVAGTLERRRSAGTELRRLEEERRETERMRGQLELEQAETAGRLDHLTKQFADCETQLVTLAEAKVRTAQAVAAAVSNLEKARAGADAEEAKLAELHTEESEVRQARTVQEVEDARLKSEFEHLVKTCRNELGESLESLHASAEQMEPTDELRRLNEMSLDDLAADLEDLKGKIEALGPVNMLALEELEEAEKRLEFLVTQRADVLDAIGATEEALAEIRRRTKQRFLEAFTRINGFFTEIFQELFGGGRGEMVLIDQEDVLESGIEIIAQPPGKRLQSVLLLSGGEKAMAALALVMAIFRFRPSPFCVLDEVDAPLDDANINRFAGKVSEMSAQTQFLVITHNKQTMESANCIYGVTMQEPGVSKLLSVRFE